MSAICSICGGSMTVQAGEGTAACLACECAGLHERIEELEEVLRARRGRMMGAKDEARGAVFEAIERVGNAHDSLDANEEGDADAALWEAIEAFAAAAPADSEADPAERVLEALEMQVGPLMWDTVSRRFHDKSGKERSIEIGRRTLDASGSALRYFIDDVKATRAEALALLRKEKGK